MLVVNSFAGVATVTFESEVDMENAMRRNKNFIGKSLS